MPTARICFLGGSVEEIGETRGYGCKKGPQDKTEGVIEMATQELLTAELGALMGIESVEVNTDEMSLVYGLLQVSMKNIENVIFQTHGHMKQTMTDKLRKGLIQYSEDCELDDMAHLSENRGCH